MAININKVYQKVLAIANKEQRGYITPQEFNLFADYAQMEIFEQYFYDLEQRQRAVGNETDYSDIVSNIEEKISLFEMYDDEHSTSEISVSTAVDDFYRLGSVKVLYSTHSSYKMADKMKLNEINKYENSLLAAPKASHPVYIEFSTTAIPVNIKIIPQDNLSLVSFDYIRKPKTPNWTYIISSTGNALYSAIAQTQHFELHSSEENNLVTKILQLAGISIKDLSLTQATGQEEGKRIQLQKQ